MTGANLPEDVTAVYPATIGEDASAAPHRDHHTVLHQIVNQFEYPTSPGDGDVPLHNGSTYVPTALSAAVGAEVQNYLGSNPFQAIYGGNADPNTTGSSA